MIGPVDDRTHRNYLFKTSASSNSEATFAVSTEGPEVHARVQAGDGRVFLLNNDGGPRQGMKVLNFPGKFITFLLQAPLDRVHQPERRPLRRRRLPAGGGVWSSPERSRQRQRGVHVRRLVAAFRERREREVVPHFRRLGKTAIR